MKSEGGGRHGKGEDRIKERREERYNCKLQIISKGKRKIDRWETKQTDRKTYMKSIHRSYVGERIKTLQNFGQI